MKKIITIIAFLITSILNSEEVKIEKVEDNYIKVEFKLEDFIFLHQKTNIYLYTKDDIVEAYAKLSPDFITIHLSNEKFNKIKNKTIKVQTFMGYEKEYTISQ